MKKDKMQAKVHKVMREWKEGTLHSGKGGKVVKSQKLILLPQKNKSFNKKLKVAIGIKNTNKTMVKILI